jgi:hypothetical protein
MAKEAVLSYSRIRCCVRFEVRRVHSRPSPSLDSPRSRQVKRSLAWLQATDQRGEEARKIVDVVIGARELSPAAGSV